MIHFSLACDQAHEFDGWFRHNEDFEKQVTQHLVSCPVCGSTKIEKTLMTPAVSTSRKKERVGMGLNDEQRQALEKLRKLAQEVREKADYVGENFAEEARKIHYGEKDPHAIYGEANVEEVSSLLDEGIAVMPLPSLPEDKN